MAGGAQMTASVYRCSTGGGAPLSPPSRVIVWVYDRAGKLQQWPADLVDGPKLPRGASFNRYLVRPRSGRLRWVSVISIVSSIRGPSGRLPA
jgi:hypothetical protein